MKKDKQLGSRLLAAGVVSALLWALGTMPAAQDISVDQAAQRLFAEAV